jgi:hypothetical protein
MTLKEKFADVIFDNLWDHKGGVIVPEVEKITDEFAIGFKEWCDINEQRINYSTIYTPIELLKIYKKEKGL